MGERYRAALHHLVRTQRGSIPWAPEYGTLIHLYRTQSIADQDVTELLAELTTSVQTWVPDIRLLGVKLATDLETMEDDERLSIEIAWGIPDAGVAGPLGQQQPRFVYGPVTQTITV
jgi:phage baseplate assembly protein W